MDLVKHKVQIKRALVADAIAVVSGLLASGEYEQNTAHKQAVTDAFAILTEVDLQADVVLGPDAQPKC